MDRPLVAPASTNHRHLKCNGPALTNRTDGSKPFVWLLQAAHYNRMTLYSLLIITQATLAKPPDPRPRPAVARAFIPDDSDPCDFERFKQDAELAAWVRETSPNTATSAKCFHSPAKLLPAASALMDGVAANTVTQTQGKHINLNAAALTGYQIDSVIQVEKDGQRMTAVLLRSGVNGPTASGVYLAK